MKKKISVICAVSIMAVAATSRDYARAETKTIHSYGNLVFRDGGQMELYSSDIQYLKGELDRLFGEIPND